VVNRIRVYPGKSVVPVGGQAVTTLYGPLLGGIIQNPATAADQGIGTIEDLYVDIVTTAQPGRTTSTALQPGGYYIIPPTVPPDDLIETTTNVSVWAATSGHRFTSIAYHQAQDYPPTLLSTSFPPSGPTGRLTTISSYLYREYNDDDDLQAFVDAYNGQSQQYVDWFNTIGLPVYTGPLISGLLLDWVAQGIYGLTRPVLSSFQSALIGPLDTYGFNELGLNESELVGPKDIAATSDDVFKRIITWHMYRGDGRYFNVTWLKRRIMRFLYGVNGTDNNDPPYQISVSFGVNNQLNITILAGKRTDFGGALFNTGELNSFSLNSTETSLVTFTIPDLAHIFKQAIDTGVLEMPYQFPTVVTIGF
jgi:hypothetical protein